MANPFTAPSSLPFQLPDFDAIGDDDFLPAIEAGMVAHRAEIDAILAEPEVTFDNTIGALEAGGQMLDRALTVFYARVSSHSNDTIDAVNAEVSPKLSAHWDAITLDEALFARIADLHERRATLGLDAEATRLLERTYDSHVRHGAQLSADDKERLKALNAELSSLSTSFGEKLLKGANAGAVRVDDVARLDGLSDGAIGAAATAAGGDGYLLPLVLPTGQPGLASLHDRELRRSLLEASLGRGTGVDEATDTRANIVRQAQLRAERAALLGFASHADYVIADSTAGSVDAVTTMLAKLVPAAMANADAEAAELEAIAGHEIEAWDWSYYAQKVRLEKLAVDDAALRPYLELDRVIHDGVFAAANQLFGLEFVPRDDLPKLHPDVRYWEVREADGSVLGLFGGDYFARPSKRGGAWMNALVSQTRMLGRAPVVMNTCNFTKPAPGEPALLTMDEVRTLFHEFGHALHGLFSDVWFPSLAGTAVPRDYVEFPSQVNEMWLDDPAVLARYAVHHETGEPMPAELLEKVRAARAYGEGFATTEYLAATLLDQAWHQLDAEALAELGPDDVEAFEADALAKAGIAHPKIPPRYRSTYFNHIFGGGYSAAYYSYIWAEVLDADAGEWFVENGGLTRENGQFFREQVLSKGNSVDAMEGYLAFRGKDPDIAPLLRRRRLG